MRLSYPPFDDGVIVPATDLGQSMRVHSDGNIFPATINGRPVNFPAGTTVDGIPIASVLPNAVLVGYSQLTGTVSAADTVLSAIGRLAGNAAAQAFTTSAETARAISAEATKQNLIATGSTSQYLRGDLSLATFPTNLNQFTNGPGFITSAGAPVQSVNGATGTVVLVLPANTTATTSNFLTAYNSTTGAFTKVQPAFSDLSGAAVIGQLPTGTTSSTVSLGNHTHTFASLTSVPTTLAGYGITDSTNKLVPTAAKTANYTAAANELVLCDTTSGGFTVTFPTAPADGTRVAVKQITRGGTNVVSLALGGSDVFNKAGGGTTGTLTLLNQAVVAQYKTSGAVWIVTGDDLPLSQLDLRYTQLANNLSDLASVSTARTNLGLVIGTNVQAWDTDLDTWAAVTRASGFDTFVTTPTSANLALLLTDENGTAGGFVRATNATLTTPTIGVATATSVTFTNGGAITDNGTGAIALTASGTNQSITLTPSGTGAVLSIAGTAGNPTYSFTGDPDTGIYNRGANEIGFTLAGALATRVTSITNGGRWWLGSGTIEWAGGSPTANSDLGILRNAAGVLGIGGPSGAGFGQLAVGSIVLQVLTTPATTGASLTITLGASGSYTYKFTAEQADGTSTDVSAAVSTAVGPTTLDGTHFITITAPSTLPTNATRFGVYRTVGGAAQGKIGTIAAASGTLVDNGLTASGTAPTQNLTGNLLVGNGATNSVIQFGGRTASFPMWKRAATVLGARLADDTADAPISASDLSLSGSIKTSTAITARAYNSANISIANNTLVPLTFDSERWDTDSIHSTVTNTSRLTCNTAGTYVISGNAVFASSTAGTVRSVIVYLNGATPIARHQIGPPNNSCHIAISTVYQLAATDYVELWVYQDSGGALNVLNIANYSPEFSLVRIA